MPTGALRAELKQSRNLFSLAMSPDNSRIATGDREGVVRLWDWGNDTHHDVASLEISSGGGHGLAFSPDGRLLAATADSGFVRVFDLTDNFRSHDYVIPAAVDGVWSVAFSPDQKAIAAGSGLWHTSGEVTIWELGKAVPVVCIRQSLPVLAVSFSPCDGAFAWGGVETNVYLRKNVYEGDEVILRGHRNSITSIAFSADCKLLATGSYDGSAIVWDLRRVRIGGGK